MSPAPRVSIITACRNARNTIRQSIESVLRQSHGGIEYIVVDGASTDGTVDILREYRSAGLAFISEPDRGPPDAWNKGLQRATGEIIGLLNADDVYEQDAVAAVVRGLGPEERVLTYGITRFFDKDPGVVQWEPPAQFRPARVPYGFGFMHPTCFTTRTVYEEVGAFDTRYRVAFDTDFLLRCLRAGVAFRRLDNITYMRLGGLSERHLWRARIEFYGQLVKYGYPAGTVADAFVRFLYEQSRRLLKRLLYAPRRGAP